LNGANGAPFATYTEGGFTVTPTGGQFFEAQVFGNPVPSIVAGSAFGGPNANNAIAVTDSVLPFTLSAIDLASANAIAVYTFIGTLAGAPVFGVNAFASSPAFNTEVFSGISDRVIDRLVISATFVNIIEAGSTSTNIDNIVVEKVPGPIAGAGLPGLILAGGGLLAWWRRRQNIG
jgi:hypothetical protein